ncbi:uncharacterized protein TrAFT101_008788 [Trichoderma asperellum]|uniref:uncharacterized protein n=1 Tax=Trichoderma asperellum TaxID=101201 RepID=UPI003328EC58|nr:hypothetical protein TrAFT101_008788 [Trichoderma asperellum]
MYRRGVRGACSGTWLAGTGTGLFQGSVEAAGGCIGRLSSAQQRSVAQLQALVVAQWVASVGRSLCWNPASPAWPAWGRGTATARRYQYEQYLAENPTESLRTAYRGWLCPTRRGLFSSRRKGASRIRHIGSYRLIHDQHEQVTIRRLRKS